MEERISRFIKKQTCAGICCVDETGNPYCFSCFYAFNSDRDLLIFKSSSSARHSSLLTKNPSVAGTIQPDKLKILVIKGIQFEGIVLQEDHRSSENAAAEYYKKFPMALAIPGEIWTVQLNIIKMTDSTLGFGKKVSWKRNEFANGL